MLKRTFKYRLYPTKAQAEALQAQLAEACRLYNAALQERIEAYRTHRKSVSYVEQAAQLTEIRALGDFGLPNCHCAQDVLRRLDKAFQAFFWRVQRGQKPGFPRYKSRRRYDSLTFPSHGDGNHLRDEHLELQGVGAIKIKLHRPLRGQIKTVSVKRECDAWYVCFSVECGLQPLPESAKPLVWTWAWIASQRSVREIELPTLVLGSRPSEICASPSVGWPVGLTRDRSGDGKRCCCCRRSTGASTVSGTTSCTKNLGNW
jgi:transposase